MLRPIRLIFILLIAAVAGGIPGALAAQIATPASQTATPVAGVGNGSLLAAMDPSVPPGQDFYRYATGRWQDAATIPPDRAAYSISNELNDLTIEQLLGLLKRLSASDTLPEGSDEWKAVQLFAQGIDYDTRNAQGIAPIAGDLARIEAISTLDELYAFLRDDLAAVHLQDRDRHLLPRLVEDAGHADLLCDDA